MDDEDPRIRVTALVTRLEALGRQLTSQNANGCAPMGHRVSLELRYGQCYQELVRLGARPPLRGKYRRGA